VSISLCPIATIHAPINRVWSFLSQPANYALWWDAETRRITPPGPARSGQKIFAQTTALGKRWDVHVLVKEVDAAGRWVDLKTMLPFGITVHNHITCTPLDDANTRVAFG